jgi:EAL and modified HD-GYP domain-containing signal transduction protein
VAEILETVEPEDRVIAACKRLKAAGYLIALDDFAPNDPRVPRCEFADIIKVDVRATRLKERAGMMRRFGTPKCKVLAEKLETPHEFHQARDMGFAYFQGYYFLPPRSRHRPRGSGQPLALHSTPRNGLPHGNRHA